MVDLLLKLKDGAIKNIDYDSWYSRGCETCDYGSSYVNEYNFSLSKGSVRVEVNKMYGYAFSEGDMMKLILSNVELIKEFTEDEFAEWLKKEIESEAGESNVEFEYNKRED